MEPSKSCLVVLSDEEADELYRFTRYSYISATTYPALSRLLNRVSRRVQEVYAQPDTDRIRGAAALGVSPGGGPSGLVSES